LLFGGGGESLCEARRALVMFCASIFLGQEGSREVCGPSQLRHLGMEEGQQEGVGRRFPSLGHPVLGHRCWERVWLRAQIEQVGPSSGQVW
jgi:hypothetical protein